MNEGKAAPNPVAIIGLTVVMLILMAISWFLLTGFASIALAIAAFGSFWAGLSYLSRRAR